MNEIVEKIMQTMNVDISPYHKLCEMIAQNPNGQNPNGNKISGEDFGKLDLVCVICFAIDCHRFQLRDDGEQYIHHVLRVAESCVQYGIEAVIAALLHDTIEDGHTSMLGIEETIIITPKIKEALYDLTKHAGELYCDFIFRIEKSPSIISKQVKIKDIADNSRGKKDNRYIKYQLSSRILENCLTAQGVEW